MNPEINPSLRQYIDLVREHRGLIDSHSASVLNEMRSDALASLTAHGLPAMGEENYPITDLPALLAPDYGLNLARVNIDVNPVDSFRCDVPAVSTSLFFLINDTFVATPKATVSFPKGVIVESLARAAADHPDLVGKYYGSAADLSNPLVALDTMLVQDGLFVYIPQGVTLEKPLQLVNILQNGMPLMAVRRLLIVVDDDAEAQLLCCDHTQNGDTDFLALQTVEIILGRNARFSYYDMEESSERTIRLSALYTVQGEGSRLVLDGMTLFNGTTRNEYYCRLDGRDADLRLLGMGIEDADRRLDTLTFIDHAVPCCHSDELFKYVADDSARCSFAGRILVRPGAHHTDSYQNNRNILGSDKARIYSKPQLEIYNDDVKCSHGSAIGQIDELQLFYMRTRGIEEATARRLLKQAFMADVIDAVRMPGLKERLRMLVERRFAGDSSSCAECPVHAPAEHVNP